VVDGKILSLRLPRGYAIEVFAGDNFRGKSKIFEGAISDLAKKGFKEPVRSARVMQRPVGPADCGPGPGPGPR